jgi:energy-coupling factor transporter ATP-binding protein EcfA2
MAGDEVFAWLGEQPAWQRDLGRRLAVRVDLDGDAYDDALRMVKMQHGVASDRAVPSVVPISRDDFPEPEVGPTTRLLRFGRLQGVGLVSRDEELRFEPTGLTLIYGQNAAGKSSYVRALKVLSRTVDRDCDVRGSVYAAGPTTTASAEIETEVAGCVTASRTSLAASAAFPLQGLSVFDATCAELYVNSQNLVQYIPPELRLLARLGALQDRMRRDIAVERQPLQNSEPSREAYPTTTAVGRALAQLNGRDDDPDLAVLASLNEDEQLRLLELRALVATAAASTNRDDALAAQRDAADARALVAALTALTERATQESADRLRQAAVADDAAHKAVLLAAAQLAGAAPGIGGDPWRVRWEAARTFVEAGGTTFPPSEGQPCPCASSR